MVLGLKPVGKLVTSKGNIYVLDSTMDLHGPQTQTYGEISYFQRKYLSTRQNQVLHGPQTQTYGETS